MAFIKVVMILLLGIPEKDSSGKFTTFSKHSMIIQVSYILEIMFAILVALPIIRQYIY
jgi:hypothetical protein